MKNNIFSRGLCFCLCALLLAGAMPLSVYANSAQSWFRGVDANGVIVSGEQSPLVVERELLTFELSELPAPHSFGDEALAAYGAKVSAEYTFYNPSSYTVTARLMFPFGHLPDYFYGYELDDSSKYDIRVNGEPIEKSVRHSFSDGHDRFSLDDELPLLQDSFVSDDFYSPELRVTEYVFSVSGIDTEKYRSATIGFDIEKGLGDHRIYFPEQNGAQLQPGGAMRLHSFVSRGEGESLVSVFVIGSPLETFPEWHAYKNGGVDDRERIPGSVTLLYTSELTFFELALAERGESSPVSEVDWYNAVVEDFNRSTARTGDHPYVTGEYFNSRFESRFMRWYEYELTLAPGERLVNCVTAPIYPALDLDFDPDIYEYTYLLSPAKTWKSFGELEIVVKTPYYITESGIDGFEKTEDGYSLTLDGLPDGELTFTLSRSESPKREPSPYATAFAVLIAGIGGVALLGFSLVGLALSGVAIGIVFICRAARRRGREGSEK